MLRIIDTIYEPGNLNGGYHEIRCDTCGWTFEYALPKEDHVVKIHHLQWDDKPKTDSYEI